MNTEPTVPLGPPAAEGIAEPFAEQPPAYEPPAFDPHAFDRPAEAPAPRSVARMRAVARLPLTIATGRAGAISRRGTMAIHHAADEANHEDRAERQQRNRKAPADADTLRLLVLSRRRRRSFARGALTLPRNCGAGRR